MPQVSVVVACYNAQPFLGAAMESMLQQSFHDWEMIVVNDGSTDESGKYLHTLASRDPRVQVIDQENQGQNAAANRAISLARAPLIARMDADDVSDPTRLAKQVAYLNSNPSIGLVGTQIRRLGEKHCGLNSNFPIQHDQIIDALRQNHHAICNPTILFRRSLFERTGGYWEHDIAEDWDMFLRMGEISRLANLEEILFSYRFHRGSINGRRIVEAQLYNEFAAELSLLREQNKPEISHIAFLSNHRSRRWPTSWLFSIDSHSIGQYREAIAEIYGGRALQGYTRLALSMVMSPLRTLRRAGRMGQRMARQAFYGDQMNHRVRTGRTNSPQASQATVSQSALPPSTISQATISQATISQASISQATISQATISQINRTKVWPRLHRVACCRKETKACSSDAPSGWQGESQNHWNILERQVHPIGDILRTWKICLSTPDLRSRLVN